MLSIVDQIFTGLRNGACFLKLTFFNDGQCLSVIPLYFTNVMDIFKHLRHCGWRPMFTFRRLYAHFIKSVADVLTPHIFIDIQVKHHANNIRFFLIWNKNRIPPLSFGNKRFAIAVWRHISDIVSLAYGKQTATVQDLLCVFQVVITTL